MPQANPAGAHQVGAAMAVAVDTRLAVGVHMVVDIPIMVGAVVEIGIMGAMVAMGVGVWALVSVGHCMATITPTTTPRTTPAIITIRPRITHHELCMPRLHLLRLQRLIIVLTHTVHYRRHRFTKVLLDTQRTHQSRRNDQPRLHNQHDPYSRWA